MTSSVPPPPTGRLVSAIPRTCALGLCTAAAVWVGACTVFAADLKSVGTVAVAAVAVLITQLAILARAGHRLDRELDTSGGMATPSSGELLSGFAPTAVVHTLAAATLVAPLVVVGVGGALGVGMERLLPSCLVPFAIAQIVFSLSTFISTRGSLRRRALKTGVAIAAAPSSTVVRVLVGLTFTVPIPLAVLLVISAAHVLYQKQAHEYQATRLHQQAKAVLGCPDIPIDDALIAKLTPFDSLKPVSTSSPEARESHSNARVIPSTKSHTIIALAEPQATVGIKANLTSEGLPLPISVGLVLIAIFTSGLAAARVFTVMIGARRQLTARLDALPERLLKTPFDSPLYELQHFDELLRRLKQRFDEMRQRQRRSIESGRKDRELKAQFFAGMSHDLRSPLNSIIGFTDLLLGGIEGDLSLEQKRAVLAVSVEAEKLMSLIADILDTSKLDAGRFDLDRAWVPPVEIVSGCTAEARRLLGTKAIEITPAVQAGLPPVYVDKSRIQQALIGLITRVTQNTTSGAFRIKACSERMATGEQMLRIDIIDVAVTLSDTERILLNEALTGAASIPARSTTGALGLGIALARDLIHLHHGDLLTHQSGATVFSVVLPLDDPNGRD